MKTNFRYGPQMAVGIIVLAFFTWGLFDQNQDFSLDPLELQAEAPQPTIEELYPHVIMPGTTVFSTLRQLGVSPLEIQNLVQAAQTVQDLRRIHSGVRFRLDFEDGPEKKLVELQFRNSAVESLKIRKIQEQWKAEKIQEQVDLQLVTFSGRVSSSLWESAERAKMDPSLIAELAEIFGWQVDFAREVRQNDRWRLAVEQKMVRGKRVGWGSIVAAEYENAGEIHRAILFRLKGEEVGYFSPDGKSLRRMFLKSPLRFGRVSSRFQRKRFHPILQVHRPHLGVDYAAPVGTPIRAVGDGVVTFAGFSGGGGNVIKIRHNSTYQTAYKHLSGYAKGIRSGARVTQGQTIGYVGNTGLSTAPHLHYEFFQNGQFIDPLGKKFPSADPVAPEHLSQFNQEAATQLSFLPSWDSREVTVREKTASESNRELIEGAL